MKQLYNPRDGQMRVVGLMSGSGSNIEKILEAERRLNSENGESPYKMVGIFSDRYNSNATKIGRDFDIPVIIRDIRAFYKARGKPRKDLGIRAEFDAETVRALKPFEASVAAFGGYMSIATAPLMNAFLGLNVHPSNLSILNANGERKYTGDHAVRDAILAGEKEIRSTTHLIEPQVDYGRILMISAPLKVELDENFDSGDKESVKSAEDFNQTRLKELGDWIIFPKTLEYLATGRFVENCCGEINWLQ
ncbi:MAG: formyl transferase [Nanoarchaeota archaeon]|nr:formyl transferase [Nanoarchaeota archaeon]